MAHSIETSRSIAIDGTTLSGNATISNSARISISEAIANDAADAEIAVGFDVGDCTLFYAECDIAVTIEVNDGTTAEATLTLAANTPYLWDSSQGAPFSFGTDVLEGTLTSDELTNIFVTGPDDGGDAGTLRIEALYDSSP